MWRQCMSIQPHNFKLDDTVKVKEGILEPDTEAFSIGGWQGRIIAIRESENESTVIDIEWDSATLRNMPTHFIEECEEEGFDWASMGLYPEDVEATVARDSEDMVEAVREELEDTYLSRYSWLGEQGKRIHAVLHGIDPQNDCAATKRWGAHLQRHLSFPFEADVEEWQERGPLRTGDRVKVKGISLVDDSYGVIVALRRGRERVFVGVELGHCLAVFWLFAGGIRRQTGDHGAQ